MSHNPPIPGGAKSPYPLHKPQAEDRDDAQHRLAEKVVVNLNAASPEEPGRTWPRYAAGAAVGSAAIVAALLFYNRPKVN